MRRVAIAAVVWILVTAGCAGRGNMPDDLGTVFGTLVVDVGSDSSDTLQPLEEVPAFFQLGFRKRGWFSLIGVRAPARSWTRT